MLLAVVRDIIPSPVTTTTIRPATHDDDDKQTTQIYTSPYSSRWPSPTPSLLLLSSSVPSFASSTTLHYTRFFPVVPSLSKLENSKRERERREKKKNSHPKRISTDGVGLLIMFFSFLGLNPSLKTWSPTDVVFHAAHSALHGRGFAHRPPSLS